jgi:hypothetical protein
MEHKFLSTFVVLFLVGSARSVDFCTIFKECFDSDLTPVQCIFQTAFNIECIDRNCVDSNKGETSCETLINVTLMSANLQRNASNTLRVWTATKKIASSVWSSAKRFSIVGTLSVKSCRKKPWTWMCERSSIRIDGRGVTCPRRRSVPSRKRGDKNFEMKWINNSRTSLFQSKICCCCFLLLSGNYISDPFPFHSE